MKKQITILVFAMLLSVAGAFAQGGTTGPLTWNINNGTLTISGSGAMPDYSSSDFAPWWDYRESITTAVIENGVTTIGDYALGNPGMGWNSYDYLTSITIPNSVTTIGKGAFLMCSALKSITLPNSITKIEEGTFAYCRGLVSISIPEGVTSIGDDYDPFQVGAFRNCESLTSVTLPNTLTTIRNYTFTKCTALNSITIPSGVTTIGDYTFSECTALTAVTISNGVTTIGNSMFSGCSALKSIDIPNSVTTIGNNAFNGCEELVSVTLPNGITKIEYATFAQCKVLESITIPNGVTSIEDGDYSWQGGAFASCESLTSVTLPNSLITIGNGTFYACTDLKSITLPSGVTTIGFAAFYDCTALTSVTNMNPVPVGISSYEFENVDKSACTLTVPTSAVSAYKNAEVWQDFNIAGGGLLVYPKVDDPEHGYVTGNDLYEGRATATVTATAYSGYKFVNWTIDGVVVSKDNSYSFTVTEDIELVANFEEGVGIDDVETWHAASLQVYPNPTTGELKITCYRHCGLDPQSPENNEIAGQARNDIHGVDVFDVMGRTVHVETLRATSLQSEIANRKSQIEINISHLPTGIYFLRITTDAGVVVRKVVKR